MKFDLSTILEVIKDPDLKLKIAGLYSKNLKLENKVSILKKQIEELQKQEEIQSKLIFKNNHYYLSEEDIKNEFSFCTRCWDVEKKLVRIHKVDTFNGQDRFECPNCKNMTTKGDLCFPEPSYPNIHY